MDNEEKLNSEEYFVLTVTTQILETKKRLDRLVFLLILITAIGGIYYKNPPESFNFLISKITPVGYHLGIIFGLLGVFAMIGSKFIDYIIKRRKIDNYLLNDSFLIQNYKREYVLFPEETSEKETIKNKLHYISKTVIPSSFYEFFYTLFLSKKDLRLPSAIILMCIFMSAHAVSIIHVVNICEGNYEYIGAIGMIACYIIFYNGFLGSIKKYREELVSSALLFIASTGIVAILLLIIGYKM